MSGMAESRSRRFQVTLAGVLVSVMFFCASIASWRYGVLLPETSAFFFSMGLLSLGAGLGVFFGSRRGGVIGTIEGALLGFCGALLLIMALALAFLMLLFLSEPARRRPSVSCAMEARPRTVPNASHTRLHPYDPH